MARLAVIGTFWHRPELVPTILWSLRQQTRPADEVWLMCETDEDEDALRRALYPDDTFRVVRCNVPRNEQGEPLVIPPSYQINAALDESTADYFVYLADDSLPHPLKFELMARELDKGASVAYCAQDRGQVLDSAAWLAASGSRSGGTIAAADVPTDDPYCRIDMTQVMHLRSEDRWPLDMQHRKIGDAVFFVALRDRFGAFAPVPEVLDWHRQMPSGITARW